MRSGGRDAARFDGHASAEARAASRLSGLLSTSSRLVIALLIFGVLLTTSGGAAAEDNDTPGPLDQLTGSGDVYTSCPHLTDSVARLYEAYFDRAPDAAGFDYWAGELASGRADLDGISTFFANSPEFVSIYGSDNDAADFVRLVYRNVLGRSADAEGLAFWVSQLRDGDLTRGAVMLNFSESPEFVALTATSTPLAGHFGWYPPGTRFVCGRGTFDAGRVGTASEIDVLTFVDVRMPVRKPQNVNVVLQESGAATNLVSELVPLNLLLLRNIELPAAAGTSRLQVQGDEAAFTYIVVVPNEQSDFSQRSGWREGERLPTLAEFLTELDVAVDAVNHYWKNNAESLTGNPYVPPNVIGLYDGTNTETAPRCGAITLGPNNAFYCGNNNTVAWDISLMAQGYAIGDAFVYFVIAHEWSHAIQRQGDPSQRDVASELQADCFAGAALYGAVAPGAETPARPLFQRPSATWLRPGPQGDNVVIFEPGDVDELLATLTRLADDHPWMNPRSHGNAEERVEAFGEGASSGPLACLPK